MSDNSWVIMFMRSWSSRQDLMTNYFGYLCSNTYFSNFRFILSLKPQWSNERRGSLWIPLLWLKNKFLNCPTMPRGSELQQTIQYWSSSKCLLDVFYFEQYFPEKSQKTSNLVSEFKMRKNVPWKLSLEEHTIAYCVAHHQTVKTGLETSRICMLMQELLCSQKHFDNCGF